MDSLVVMRRTLRMDSKVKPAMKSSPGGQPLPQALVFPSNHIKPKISFVQLYNDLCLYNKELRGHRRPHSANIQARDTVIARSDRLCSESAESVLKSYLSAQATRHKNNQPKLYTRHARTQLVLEMGYDEH